MRRLSRLDEFFNKFEKAYFDRQRALAEHEDDEDADSAYVPKTDIEESDTLFLILMDIPGLKREEVRIDLEGNILRVSGERHRPTHEDPASYYERAHGKFVRRFALPDNIDIQHIDARFEDGVLRVILPKMELPEPHEIKIN